jgi:hypothetical protein
MEPNDREQCQELEPFERNKYFAGKLVTEKDLTDEQSYHRAGRKQHNRYLHGYGVVCGLRVVPSSTAEPKSVLVEPGLALDPWGREIVVPEPVQFEVGERGCRDTLKFAGRTKSLFLVIEYREVLTDTIPVPVSPDEPGSDSHTQPSRICETYQLGLRRKPPEVDDNVSLQVCELLADAVRKGVETEKLYSLLCEYVSRPCRPCAPDPAVTLARIDLPTDGGITANEIDNCSHRQIALSTDRILQILLFTLNSLQR